MSSRRDEIIEATCTLLERQGYHATGVNQILEEAQAPKGTLYYYFPGGKEELAVEAISASGQVIENRIRQQLAGAADPAEAVASFIRNVGRQVEASGFQAGGPLTTIALESASTSEPLREACRDVYHDWQQAVADRLEAGGFPPEPARRLATITIAAIEGAIILSRSERRPRPLYDVAEEMAALIEARRAGLSPGEGSAA